MSTATHLAPLTLEMLQSEAHQTAVDKGWHTKPDRSIGDLIALCHSELSEALEVFREEGIKGLIHITHADMGPDSPPKPEGFPIEMADLLIRVADLAEHYGINLTEAVRIKLAYNKSRSHRHGGKVI